MREYLWPMKQKWTQVCTFTKIDTWIGREQNNYKVNCYKTSSLIFVTPPLDSLPFKWDWFQRGRLSEKEETFVVIPSLWGGDGWSCLLWSGLHLLLLLLLLLHSFWSSSSASWNTWRPLDAYQSLRVNPKEGSAMRPKFEANKALIFLLCNILENKREVSPLRL